MEWFWAVGGLLERKTPRIRNLNLGAADVRGHVWEETDGEDRAME
jgi:hypothetical protein